MSLIRRKAVLVAAVLLTVCLSGGCGERSGREMQDFASSKDSGATIGSLVSVIVPEPIPVEGFGLVAGLEGTGSAECPPQIRAYLKQYTLRQLPAKIRLNVDKFIDSPNTAVVSVQGVIPAIASKNQYFDVRVAALPSTQTTSLDGGQLYTAELMIIGSLGVKTRILADAEGPVYIDKIDDAGVDNKTGYILAGGKVLDEYKIILTLHKPDFGMANRIRNRINGRFDDAAAKAVSSERVEFVIPPKYKEQKQRFVSIVTAMYLTQEPTIDSKRINTYVKGLSGSQDKYSNEVALEAIGNECLDELGVLLKSSDEKTRLHAGRCTLNLGSDAGLMALRQIALDKESAYRVEALESITMGAKRNDAVSISRKLLRDDDFHIRLAAYEQLRKLDDVAITQEFVGRNFYLEQVTQTELKTVFVSRSGQPRIVLFGAPIYCNGNIFVESGKGDVIINAPSGQKYVDIIRKHPKRPSVITQLKSSFEIGDIIRTLCDEPVKEGEKGRSGLGVSYADAAALLKQMCDMGVVKAEFHAGPMPKIGLNIKK
ncbi:MAG: flagellar basal body P-ring protein FlgI [Sedimentisphaerales bacterium]|nr:flagellar basal body P-ring protein FlgI [Sedimentisphaerales bacterium]